MQSLVIDLIEINKIRRKELVVFSLIFHLVNENCKKFAEILYVY